MQVQADKLGLTEQLIKNLQDRSLEKRSTATNQVKADIEELAVKGDNEGIKLRIMVFEKLTQEWSTYTSRRAGLYGLSAIGVALYQKNVCA